MNKRLQWKIWLVLLAVANVLGVLKSIIYASRINEVYSCVGSEASRIMIIFPLVSLILLYECSIGKKSAMTLILLVSLIVFCIDIYCSVYFHAFIVMLSAGILFVLFKRLNSNG